MPHWLAIEVPYYVFFTNENYIQKCRVESVDCTKESVSQYCDILAIKALHSSKRKKTTFFSERFKGKEKSVFFCVCGKMELKKQLRKCNFFVPTYFYIKNYYLNGETKISISVERMRCYVQYFCVLYFCMILKAQQQKK